MKTRIIGFAALAVFAAGCATMVSDEERASQALAVMKAGFKDNGQAKVDRLDQDEVQKLCSTYVGEKKLPKDVAARIEKSQLDLVKYPADGKLVGDWKAG